MGERGKQAEERSAAPGAGALRSFLLACALMFAMPCVTSVWAGDNVTYWEGSWDEATNTVTWTSKSKANGEYTEVKSTDVSWGNENTESWYVAEGTVEIPSRVTVTGNVHLILKDGCNLTVNGGIQVAGENSLTIYAQTENGEVNNVTGQLTAKANGNTGDAGIGGNGVKDDNNIVTGETAGAITIHGGTVTAIGNDSDAGIGGGKNGSAGTFSTTGADSQKGTAVIYASGTKTAISDQSKKAQWSGIIFEKSGNEEAYTGAVYGDQTLQDDMTLSEKQTFDS